jgi:hypothetical protein
MLTRRCAQHTFLLRPDGATNSAFLYCLVLAAIKFDVDVLFTLAESTHTTRSFLIVTVTCRHSSRTFTSSSREVRTRCADVGRILGGRRAVCRATARSRISHRHARRSLATKTNLVLVPPPDGRYPNAPPALPQMGEASMQGIAAVWTFGRRWRA